MAILRLAMAQVNLLVGDITGNLARITDAAVYARDQLSADVIVFPELTVTGYPPEDLLLRFEWLDQVEQALVTLRAQVQGIVLVVGHPERADGKLYNAASVLHDGRVLGTYHKHLLPNYGVFDEKRYFSAGHQALVVTIAGVAIGVTICEDLWHAGPAEAAAHAGAQLLVNLNASPYHVGKTTEREAVLQARVRATACPIVYVNLVGGQDELVFDGESMVIDAHGCVAQRAPAFEEAIALVTWTVQAGLPALASAALAPESCPRLPLEESVYRALVLGVRDYVRKNQARGALVGLSGGIDSALTLAIAVDALGADQVHAVMMPSRYSASMSLEDAYAEVQALGVCHSVLSIEQTFQAFLTTLTDEFAGLAPDVTEENLQARCRGMLLMALSNKSGKLVLTTSNKSEAAVGYATLYGDMAGGLAVIKDVPKTLVYRLARYRNGLDPVTPVIPERVITRPPSAELRPDQRDEDSLPPYDLLDPILELYLEGQCRPEEIIAAGYAPEMVQRIVTLVHRAEYKRRQSAPGIRITRRAFGRDWRYPISSGFGRP